MDSLSNEVLMQVFAFLDLKGRGNSQRVCRRWRSILNTLEMPAVTV